MYRRPKFLEILLEIRETMSREADFDVRIFAEKNLSVTPPVESGDFAESPRRSEKNHSAKNKIRFEQKIELKIGNDK